MAGAAGLTICCLVKEVPDRSSAKRIDPRTMRLDRGGQRTLNPFDAHAIEAACRIREQGASAVSEVVAVTMGPDTATRALHRAMALGADRSVHLCDQALAGSDSVATGYALAMALERERPDLVLLGQQSADGECFAIGPLVAEYLAMPSLTQVIRIEVVATEERPVRLLCERQAEYGYDTVEVSLPAVISVGDAINEPRYPLLKAIMGAGERPIVTLTVADLGIDPARVGERGSQTVVRSIATAPPKPGGEILEDVDTDRTVARIVAWLGDRNLV